MASRRRSLRPGQGGFVTTQAIVVYSFTMLAFIWLLNFVVMQYGRGAVREAIDEGARAGARVSASEAVCQARAEEVLDSLLGGTMGDQITISCRQEGGRMVAQATGTFTAWMPPVPDMAINDTALSLRSQAP